MKKNIELIFAISLVFAASLSRLIQHPLNFTPIGAIALFGGFYFDKKYSFMIPIASLLISDFFIGFYNSFFWVYGSFILMSLIGTNLRKNKNLLNIFALTILNSILFFVITNFGVWISGSMYSLDLKGLIECYSLAIPFFRNSFAGDLFYVFVLFGSFELFKVFETKFKLNKI